MPSIEMNAVWIAIFAGLALGLDYAGFYRAKNLACMWKPSLDSLKYSETNVVRIILIPCVSIWWLYALSSKQETTEIVSATALLFLHVYVYFFLFYKAKNSV